MVRSSATAALTELCPRESSGRQAVENVCGADTSSTKTISRAIRSTGSNGGVTSGGTGRIVKRPGTGAGWIAAPYAVAVVVGNRGAQGKQTTEEGSCARGASRRSAITQDTCVILILHRDNHDMIKVDARGSGIGPSNRR